MALRGFLLACMCPFLWGSPRTRPAGTPRYYDSAAWARYLRETPFPERMPLYRRLLVDAQRNLWAERFRPFRESESSWYVFDEQGVWLGEVATPPGLSIFEIGTDYVLGVRRDELDVPFVVVIPLDRSGPSPHPQGSPASISSYRGTRRAR